MQLRPSYRALRAFSETVQAGSAAAAGRRLGVTASAVSHLIHELENRLQMKLFVAGPNSALTEAGERLQQGIGSHFVGIDRALNGLEAPGIQVRLSTVTTFANLWLLPRLPAFTARHPEIRLGIATSRRVVRLGAEPFDCSVRWGLGDWGERNSTLLFREELIMVAAPGTEERSPFERPRIAALTRPGDWPAFLDAAGEKGAPPQLTVEDRASAVQAAILGLGVTVVDRTLVGQHLECGRLAQLTGIRCPLEEGFHFIFSPRGAAHGAVGALSRWMFGTVEADSRPAPAR